MPLFKNMLISAFLLGVFAIAGTGMVSLTYERTVDRIAANHRATLLKSLHELIPPARHDNDMFSDTLQVSDPALSGGKQAVNIYRARKNGKPVAAIIETIAPDGYNGNIYLLVAINYNGQLAGVRVVNHRETPGLGDAIDLSHGNWILAFNGKSLDNLKAGQWAVKRDGGYFDQFTGATITPRAVVKAVYNSLIYFSQHRDEIFSKEALINSTVRGEVLSLTKGRTMNAKHCKIIMLYGSPFDKLRANGINQRFPNNTLAEESSA